LKARLLDAGPFLIVDSLVIFAKLPSMKEIAKYTGCFICGENNDIGIKARFYFDGDKAVTDVMAEKRFEGYLGIYHGGITSTLLDEVMIKALLAKDIYAMTVELTVRFHKIIEVGKKLHFEGCLESKKGRLFLTRGSVTAENGDLVASATGKYLQVKEDMKSKLMESLDA